MYFLTAERRSRLRVLLTNLAEGQREHEEISRLDAQIRIDYHGRFLIELIQNAIDPAQQVGLDGARILIVHTGGALAVFNQGAPFDEEGLKSLLSLGLSAKQPDEAIGNKGVGFKSVFEVAETAEVFGVDDPAHDLASDPALRLGLARAFASRHPGLLAEAVALAEAKGLDAAIEARAGAPHADAIERALSVTSGWRFPIELGPEVWAARRRELGLSSAELGAFQTAIVLRIHPDRLEQVTAALEALRDASDEVHLFLPGLACLEIRDGERRVELRREERVAPAAGAPGVRRLTTVEDGEVVRERDYWALSGVLDGPEIAAAAKRLPGAGWAAVTRAEVHVALPVGRAGSSLAPDGRYFIGLPSKGGTGSPFRVDARFHATLSRTALDRRDNPYNRLLDRAAAQLAAELLRQLRDAPSGADFLIDSTHARRVVTYALCAEGRGSFGASVRRRLKGEPIILDRAGAGFLRADEARRVTEGDGALVALAADQLGRQAVAHLGLIDRELEQEAGDVIEALGCSALAPAQLLDRDEGTSILEATAASLARDDTNAWAALFSWGMARAGAAVSSQRILPVTSGALASPDDAPFVPLRDRPGPGQVDAASVPEMLLAELLFLDGAVLGGDAALRRELTEGATPLCRDATAHDLIARAVLPALARLVEAGEDERACELLSLGLTLMAKAPGDDDLSALPWLVPCGGGWLPAGGACLGDAWVTEAREEDEPPGVVEAVYGSVGRCVRPWWGEAEDRATARAALERAGVEDSPGIIAFPTIQKAIWGDYHSGHLQRVAAPGEIPDDTWRGWTQTLPQIPGIDWGPRTWWHLAGVEWIDGLERPEAAALLAAWALRQKHDEVTLAPEPERPPRRWHRKQPGSTIQPWLYALRRLDRPFVPSKKTCVLEGALAPPGELCLVAQRDRVPAWLPQPAAELDRGMLAAVGVRPVGQMPVAWLVRQLDRFAKTLSGGNDEATNTRGLWTLLGRRARQEALPELAEVQLPVWRDGQVVAVRGGALDRLVLVDDAYAAEILGASLEGVCLLEQGDERWSGLRDRLREALPAARIDSVSEIDVPFQSDPELPIYDLATYLRERHGPPLLALVAALLHRRDTHRTQVAQKEMRRSWQALQRARLQPGSLSPDAPYAVWLQGDGVLLTQQSTSADLVIELWPIVGPRWRGDFLALGHALSRGERALRDHLRHERISEETIADAASFFGLGEWRSAPVLPELSLHQPAVSAATAPGHLAGGLGAEPERGGRAEDIEALVAAVAAAPLPQALPRVAVPSPGAEAVPSETAPRRAAPHHRSSSGNEEYARQIGHLGELFAFRALNELLPDFGRECWVSSSRSQIGLSGGDDALGYDFVYTDTSGQLSGQAGARCYIEVKANARSMRSRFSVSRNEWALAESCSRADDRVFLFVRVHGVDSARPQIGAILCDPVRLAEQGDLRLSPRDGWWVEAIEPGTESAH